MIFLRLILLSVLLNNVKICYRQGNEEKKKRKDMKVMLLSSIKERILINRIIIYRFFFINTKREIYNIILAKFNCLILIKKTDYRDL